jgi:hypothetical protein
MFFFEKEAGSTELPRVASSPGATDKSFLLLFFKKEAFLFS